MAKTPFARVMFDFLWGFVAFAVVMVVSFLYLDIRPFLLATCLAYFAAGLYRATPSKGPFRTALFVALGGVLPAVILKGFGIAFSDQPFFVFFLLACALSIALGALLRSLISLKKMKYAVAFGCLWTLVVFAVVFKAIPDWMDSRAYVTVNKDVTPFRIQTLAGKNLASEDWKGHVVVLLLWASWCTPCPAEIPEIQIVQNKYRANPNVLVFALDSATGGDTSAIAQAYLDRKKLTLTGAIDSSGVRGDSWGPAAKSLGARGIPALYILDRSGNLRAIHLGYDASEHLTQTLSRQIDRLL